MFDLHGRSVVVTGAARGIGAAVAHTLVKSGAGVVVADILDRDGSSTAAELGSRAVFRHLDVTDENQWRRVLDDAEATFGPLAVLVNNAGILDFGGVESESPAQFRHVLDVNLAGAWLGMHRAALVLPA
ncbi:SDR family NAD(P)-dependent oxidoreductase [Nocardia sp. NPDC003183]